METRYSTNPCHLQPAGYTLFPISPASNKSTSYYAALRLRACPVCCTATALPQLDPLGTWPGAPCKPVPVRAVHGSFLATTAKKARSAMTQTNQSWDIGSNPLNQLTHSKKRSNTQKLLVNGKLEFDSHLSGPGLQKCGQIRRPEKTARKAFQLLFIHRSRCISSKDEERSSRSLSCL